jgi:hypothetical protein
MSSVFKRSRDRKRPGASWYIAYVDDRGRRRTVKGCPDKAATEALARNLESEADLRRRGVIDPRTDAYAVHEARPLSDHLTDFQAALLAKGGTRKHAQVTRNRAQRVLTLARIRRVSELSLSKSLDALATLREQENLGPETINHHIRAVKAFSRWLWRDGRAREHHRYWWRIRRGVWSRGLAFPAGPILPKFRPNALRREFATSITIWPTWRR